MLISTRKKIKYSTTTISRNIKTHSAGAVGIVRCLMRLQMQKKVMRTAHLGFQPKQYLQLIPAYVLWCYLQKATNKKINYEVFQQNCFNDMYCYAL